MAEEYRISIPLEASELKKLTSDEIARIFLPAFNKLQGELETRGYHIIPKYEHNPAERKDFAPNYAKAPTSIDILLTNLKKAEGKSRKEVRTLMFREFLEVAGRGVIRESKK